MLKKVSLSSVNWGELDPEGEEDSSQNEGDSDRDSDADSDSDWEDFDDVEKTPEYNTLKLKNFARECDRYKASNRSWGWTAAASILGSIMGCFGLLSKSLRLLSSTLSVCCT